MYFLLNGPRAVDDNVTKGSPLYESIYASAGSAFRFKYHNDEYTDVANQYNIVIKFRTKRNPDYDFASYFKEHGPNPVKLAANNFRSGVTAYNYSFDSAAGINFPMVQLTDSKYNLLNKEIDTDKDGLPDYMEISIFNTDPTNPDTDGDGKADGFKAMPEIGLEGKELEGDSIDDIKLTPDRSGVMKYNGTDPTVATPKFDVNPRIEKDREIKGKTQPFKTVALVAKTKEAPGYAIVANTVADKDGNYTLKVGHVVQRGEVSHFGSDIVFEDVENRIPAMTETPVPADYTGVTLEIWSDGVDGKTKYHKAEVAEQEKMTDAEFYGVNKNIDKVLVKDKTNLDQEASKELVEKMKAANPHATGVEIKDGKVVLTYEDKSKNELTLETDAKDLLIEPKVPNNIIMLEGKTLSAEDIDAINKLVVDGNSDIEKFSEKYPVTVDENGTVTIKASETRNLVYDAKKINKPAKTLVKEATLSENDKNYIAARIKKANDIENLNVTFDENGNAVLAGANSLTIDKADLADIFVAPEKVLVEDLNNITQEDWKKAEAKIKEKNSIGDKIEATLEYLFDQGKAVIKQMLDSENILTMDLGKDELFKQMDSTKYDAKGQPINVDLNKQPNAADGIKNKEELPAESTYEFKKPVDTTTPGEKNATVVVTYPDGTTDEVEVKVNVKDTRKDNEKYDAKGQPINVDLNKQPNAADGIKNKEELPAESTYEFKKPVDTTTPGEKNATVVVTYPDGHKEEVTIKVNVTDPSEGDGGSVAPGGGNGNGAASSTGSTNSSSRGNSASGNGPNTGDVGIEAEAMGLLAGLSALLVAVRKKEEEEE